MLTTRPDDDAFGLLCRELASSADELDAAAAWPGRQLELLRQYGVFRALAPAEFGGLDWNDSDQIRAYLRLSAACLATAFVLTQPLGAARRILAGDNQWLKQRVLPRLFAGEAFATVGISHLTTSRRHLPPVVTARPDRGAFVLDGVMPWVTGGGHAEWILTGATCPDGRQILALLPTDLAGVTAAPPARLVGLSATHTGEVELQHVRLENQWLLAGPAENVLAQPGGAGTGGLTTSALAVGLASAALEFLRVEADRRPELSDAAASLLAEHRSLESDLLAAAVGNGGCSAESIRSRANSLALRASQGALTAAKGSGYVVGHPAGRWCREALFFLVWSCPRPVMSAMLCELAGL